MRDPVETIYQVLLDEAGGNLSIALRMAAGRLAYEYEHAEKLEVEVAQWRRGASLAFLRRKAALTTGPVDDVPTPITDDWIATGREA